jgi:SulP family sulfate permease
MILAILHFLRRMAETVETQPVPDEELDAELAQQGLPPLPTGVLVYEIAGPMFFGAVENFERALVQTHTEPQALVIRLRRVPFMDITGIQTLEEVIDKLRARGVTVVLCEANERVKAKLLRAGVIAASEADGYADQLAAALRQAMPPRLTAGAPAPA